MATVKQAITLKHRATTGDDPADVELDAGQQVNILKEWKRHVLIQTEDGKVFNVLKEHVDKD
jgi:predicted transcriptional regulator